MKAYWPSDEEELERAKAARLPLWCEVAIVCAVVALAFWAYGGELPVACG